MLEGSDSLRTAHCVLTTNLQCLSQYKYVITTIYLGKIFPIFHFKQGRRSDPGLKIYTMLMMINVCRYFNDTVLMITRVLSLTVWMVLLISVTFYLAAEVFTTIFSISSYVVLPNYMHMSAF